jgi:FkbM family methyltransferase
MEKSITNIKKIFIDGGAHKGEAIEMLLDKREDLKGCDIHFFEPNPILISELENISKKDKNYNIKVYHSALWIKDGEIEFLESIARWGSLGGTVIPSIEEKWGLKIDKKNPKKVPATSLPNFLDNFNDDDYIVVKLDIEGSEYFVIGELLRTGKINMINELYVEWHDHFFPHLKSMGNELRDKLSKSDTKINNDWV